MEQQLRAEEEGLAKSIWEGRQSIHLYLERISRLETHNEDKIEGNYNDKQAIIDQEENCTRLQTEYAQVRDQMVVDSNRLEVQRLLVQEVTERLRLAQERLSSDQAKVSPL